MWKNTTVLGFKFLCYKAVLIKKNYGEKRTNKNNLRKGWKGQNLQMLQKLGMLTMKKLTRVIFLVW